MVTDIRIVPGDVFRHRGFELRGIVGCAESFAFTADGESCSVPVEATAADVRSADLFMSGQARCADRDARRCNELPATISEKSIDLTQPWDDGTDEETDGETNEETTEETTGETIEESAPDETDATG